MPIGLVFPNFNWCCTRMCTRCCCRRSDEQLSDVDAYFRTELGSVIRHREEEEALNNYLNSNMIVVKDTKRSTETERF